MSDALSETRCRCVVRVQVDWVMVTGSTSIAVDAVLVYLPLDSWEGVSDFPLRCV